MKLRAMAKKYRRKNKKTKKLQKRKSTTKTLQKSVALIGFRGVGKTTLAQKLAELRRVPVISLDKKIEEYLNQTISDFVKSHGWPAFREVEKKILKELAQNPEICILDTGGGIVEEGEGEASKEKIDILKNSFFCIYLTMPDDLLLERLSSAKKTDSRPNLPGNIREILEKRKPLYLQTAHAVVDVSQATVEEAAERINRILK